MVAATKIEGRVSDDLVVRVDYVAQHREEVLSDTLDHPAIDEGRRGGVFQSQLDALIALHEIDTKIAVIVKNLAGIIRVAAAVQHRQRTVAE